jgi:hypothetical protein
MNVVLNIKKKWQKLPAMAMAGEEEDETDEAEGSRDIGAEESLNAPARNKGTVPARVLDEIPHIR